MLDFLRNLFKKEVQEEALEEEEMDEDYREVMVDHTVRIEHLEKMVAKLLGASGGRPKKVPDTAVNDLVLKENNQYIVYKNGQFVKK